MGQRHWKILRTIALFAILPIAGSQPASAQPPITALEIAQTEGGKAITTLIRTQPVYFLENSEFSKTLPALSNTIPKVTPNYLQYIVVQNKVSVTHYAIARRPDLKSYVGRVVIPAKNNTGAHTYSIVCESNFTGMRRIPPPPLIGPNQRLVCAPGTTQWTLSLIATPAELNVEAAQTATAMTRTQQAYFLENARFSPTLEALGLDIAPSTIGHNYSAQGDDRSAIQYAIARRLNLKSYVGRTVIVTKDKDDIYSSGIVCESNLPSMRIPPPPTIGPDLEPICAAGTTEWTVSSIATPAKLEAEAKQAIGGLTRSQQAYYLENSRFATTLTALGRNIRPSKIAYEYSTQATDRFAIQYGVSRRSDLKSYVGAAAIVNIPTNGDSTTTAIVCENIKPGALRPAPPILSGNGQALICAAGTRSLLP